MKRGETAIRPHHVGLQGTLEQIMMLQVSFTYFVKLVNN